MSLILDALKKSDQNRQRGKVPDLKADHSNLVPPPRIRSWRRLRLPLLILVAVVVGWSSWHFWPAGDPPPVLPKNRAQALAPSTPSPQVPAAEPAPAAQLPAEPVAAKPLEKQLVPAKTAPAESSRPARATPQAQAPTKDAETTPEVYEFFDLPSHLRQGIPELVVSVHYYTREPSARMVRINNRILREGGELPGGIRIDSIEPEGILCSVQGVRFRLPKSTVESQKKEGEH